MIQLTTAFSAVLFFPFSFVHQVAVKLVLQYRRTFYIFIAGRLLIRAVNMRVATFDPQLVRTRIFVSFNFIFHATLATTTDETEEGTFGVATRNSSGTETQCLQNQPCCVNMEGFLCCFVVFPPLVEGRLTDTLFTFFQFYFFFFFQNRAGRLL